MMFKKILKAIGIVGILAVVAFAINYPVTSVRDTDGDQLLINSDGSLTATINPAVTGNFTVSGQGSFGSVWSSGTINVTGTGHTGTNFIYATKKPTGNLTGNEAWFIGTELPYQNSGSGGGTTIASRIITQRGDSVDGNYGFDMKLAVRKNLDGGVSNRLIMLGGNTGGAVDGSIIIDPTGNDLHRSTWNVSGLTLAPGSQINTPFLNVTGTMTATDTITETFGVKAATGVFTGNMAIGGSALVAGRAINATGAIACTGQFQAAGINNLSLGTPIAAAFSFNGETGFSASAASGNIWTIVNSKTISTTTASSMDLSVQLNTPFLNVTSTATIKTFNLRNDIFGDLPTTGYGAGQVFYSSTTWTFWGSTETVAGAQSWIKIGKPGD